MFACVSLAAGYFHALPLLCVALFAGGVAWLSVMSSMNVSAQVSAPGWVRARALGFYLLVFQGGQATGSAVWGSVAEHFGLFAALAAAATGLVLSIGVALRRRFADEELDLEAEPPPA